MSVKFSPKDFFLYLAAFAAMYVSAVSLLILLFEYINRLFPDELVRYVDPYSGAIRFSIASLIVIFPIYIFLTRILNQDLRRNPEKRDYGIRKWLIFLTLFVAGLTLVIDLIVLINTFLGGDITTKFVLKVLAVLVVIGGAFMYYFYDIKGKWEKNEKLSKTIGSVVSVLVLVSILSGFFIIGSPQTQRLLRHDDAKVNDLHNIQWQIVQYWQQKEKLPRTLSDLQDPISGFREPIDKQTGEEYSYSVLGAFTFELCASFNLPSREVQGEGVLYPELSRGYLGFEESSWEHEEGYQCFERTIDPERYPPIKERI